MEFWKLIFTYIIVLQVSSLLCALLLYGFGKLAGSRLHVNGPWKISLLWLLVNSVTVLLAFQISRICFSLLLLENADMHAMRISMLSVLLILLFLPFLIKKVNSGAKELQSEDVFNKIHIYK